jgi:hypothetical protein
MSTGLPLREATNHRGLHRVDRRSVKRETESDALTPKTEPRPVLRTTPQTLTKGASVARHNSSTGKENADDDVATKGDLFSSPYLLGETPEWHTLTVVLDLDETLVNNRRLDLPNAILRPYVLEALNALRQLEGVEVVMWTASTEETAAPVVRQLSAQGTVFHDVIFRNNAWFTEPYHAKDLRLLGRPMDRVVIFDNAPNCCKINKSHSVLVEDFTGYYNPCDNTLINLYRIAEVLARDVRAGSSVPECLARLADEEAICTRVDFELPATWRHVNVEELHPLRVPPHGTFFKVPMTDF